MLDCDGIHVAATHHEAYAFHRVSWACVRQEQQRYILLLPCDRAGEYLGEIPESVFKGSRGAKCSALGRQGQTCGNHKTKKKRSVSDCISRADHRRGDLKETPTYTPLLTSSLRQTTSSEDEKTLSKRGLFVRTLAKQAHQGQSSRCAVELHFRHPQSEAGNGAKSSPRALCSRNYCTWYTQAERRSRAEASSDESLVDFS